MSIPESIRAAAINDTLDELGVVESDIIDTAFVNISDWCIDRTDDDARIFALLVAEALEG